MLKKFFWLSFFCIIVLSLAGLFAYNVAFAFIVDCVGHDGLPCPECDIYSQVGIGCYYVRGNPLFVGECIGSRAEDGAGFCCHQAGDVSGSIWGRQACCTNAVPYIESDGTGQCCPNVDTICGIPGHQRCCLQGQQCLGGSTDNPMCAQNCNTNGDCPSPTIKFTCQANGGGTDIIKKTTNYTCKPGTNPGFNDFCSADPTVTVIQATCAGEGTPFCGNNNNVLVNNNKCVTGVDHCVTAQQIKQTCGCTAVGLSCTADGLKEVAVERCDKCENGACVFDRQNTIPSLSCGPEQHICIPGVAVDTCIDTGGCKDSPIGPQCPYFNSYACMSCGEHCTPGEHNPNGCELNSGDTKTCGLNGKWGVCAGGADHTKGDLCVTEGAIHQCVMEGRSDFFAQKCQNEKWTACDSPNTNTSCNNAGQCVSSYTLGYGISDGSNCSILENPTGGGANPKCTHCDWNEQNGPKCVSGFFDKIGCSVGNDSPCLGNPTKTTCTSQRRCVRAYTNNGINCDLTHPDMCTYYQFTNCNQLGQCVPSYSDDGSNCIYGVKCTPPTATTCNSNGQCVATYFPDGSNCTIGYDSGCFVFENPAPTSCGTQECGITGFSDDDPAFCYNGNNVYKNYTVYSCENGACASDTTKVWQKSCELGQHCDEGECVSSDACDNACSEGQTCCDAGSGNYFCSDDVSCPQQTSCLDENGDADNNKCQSGEICDSITGECIITPDCNNDDECAPNPPPNNPLFCMDGNVYQDIVNYSCNNAGYSDAYCTSENQEAVDPSTTCQENENCWKGACVPKVTCNPDADPPDCSSDQKCVEYPTSGYHFCVPKEEPPVAVLHEPNSGPYCSPIPGTGLETFSWTYSDPSGRSQKGWQLQISTDSDFGNVVYDSGPQDGSTTSTPVKVVTQACQVSKCDFINYGQTYYWRVKVWNANTDLEPEWAYGDSFTYGWTHPAPWIGYTVYPAIPSPDETVTFLDNSQCYDSDGKSYLCSDSGHNNSYLWNLGPGKTVSGTTASTTYTVGGTVKSTLTITDTGCGGLDCSCTGMWTFQVKSKNAKKVPLWQEMAPF